RPTELVELDGRFGGRGGQKRIARREPFVLVVFQQRAVELIGPRSRDHVDLPADRAAVLRRQDALDDLHLGDRLDAYDLDLSTRSILGCLSRPVALHNLWTIHCRTPGASRVPSELQARRTRESNHLHYA